MLKFFLVRHADKEEGDYFNDRFNHNDQPISQFGSRQAAKLKEYFSQIPIRSIFVSEYLRTQQTARAIAEHHHIDPVVDGRLNEIDNGLVEVLSDDELKQQYPDVWKAIQDWDRDFRWPDGETGIEAQERIVSFIHDHIQQEGINLIVAHDGIIRLLLCYLLGLPVYDRVRFHIDTAGVTEFDWDETKGRWKIIRINQHVG
jgi:broad specificity phosphatase PhoE